MAVSAIDSEFLKYFAQLDEPQKKSLLELLRTFVSTREVSDPVSVEEYNNELDEAMQRAHIGQVTTLDELEKEMQLW